MTLLYVINILLILSNIVMFIAILASKKFNYDREMNSPFECGFDPISSARIPFSLQFFLICIIFLIFDVEIVLIFSIIPIFKSSNLISWTLSILFFIIILLLGLFHEWNYGALDWTS